MKKSLSVCLLAFGMAGLASCTTVTDDKGVPRRGGAAVVLQAYMDDQGACKLIQRTPGKIQTAPGRPAQWFVVGECTDATISIRRTLTKDGKPYDPWAPGADLEGSVPGPGEPGAYKVLKGTLREDAVAGEYTYQVLINGAPAEYNSLADEGDFEICPRWPCDGRFME